MCGFSSSTLNLFGLSAVLLVLEAPSITHFFCSDNVCSRGRLVLRTVPMKISSLIYIYIYSSH